jgi:nucleoside-diphosphate-sugar epimerase
LRIRWIILATGDNVNAELHVLFGAGQVGKPLGQGLLAAGKRVRIAKRSSGGVAGAEVIQGDAADRAFAVRAAQGAVTVYHCMNPPYDARIWSKLLPLYMENLIAAAGSAGARLVVLDNVYMLGRSHGRPLDEDTPMNPSSRKGEIRARVAERLFAAHARGEVVATTGRASDFYGPGGTLTALGDFFWPRALAGKTVYSPYPMDAVHTYHYIPDVAAGLATLGCADSDAYGRPWMLPCAPAGTLRELAQRVVEKTGREMAVSEIPRWMLEAMSIFVPLMRELAEMRYQWEEPFVVDDRRFRERFGQPSTDVDEAARETAAWAEEHYAA